MLTPSICPQASFQAAVDTFGGVDILSNNAGIMDEAAWEKTVSVNLVRNPPSFRAAFMMKSPSSSLPCSLPLALQPVGLPSHLTQPFVLQVGAIRGCYLALEHMSKLSGGRGGVIVNTASMAGEAEKSGT